MAGNQADVAAVPLRNGLNSVADLLSSSTALYTQGPTSAR